MSSFRPDLLANKVALITGGGTGIGLGIARAFGQHGARIVIASRKQAVLDTAAEQLRSEGIECLAIATDIRDTEGVEKLVSQTLEQFGAIDVLVNNAAGNFPARIEELSYNAFKTVVDIDLQGTFNVTKAAFMAWLKEHGGAVINITAPFDNMGVAWQAHAAAAKTGVVSFTRTAAAEWGSLGIRVNGIAPGEIRGTEGIERMEEALTNEGQARRPGTAEDIANAALFLASDAASFVSGVNLYVDGGSGVDMLKVPVY